jgi:alpha-L-rhamnosidase
MNRRSNFAFAVLGIPAVIAASFVSLPAVGLEAAKLEVTPVEPARFEKRGDIYFADFGKDVYGNLQISFDAEVPATNLIVRLGEKLDATGNIDSKPPGSVNFRQVTLTTQLGVRVFKLQIPSKPAHRKPDVPKTPPEIGEVTPFRFAEIEGSPLPLKKSALRQLFVHAPFDDSASSFDSSDATLNAVWDLCKHTMKATTAFGVYIDGERERTPYEADAYINELSHFACDLDPRVERQTVEYLLKHPTWPTEWSFHVPMIVAADYEATGDAALAESNYDALKGKLLMNKAREDGLLRAYAIVDWPGAERDGYNDGQAAPDDNREIGPEINTVVNAFYYHALQRMALLARALKKDGDAREFDDKAKQVYDSFNAKFFDATRSIYIDGEGSRHASLHANMFPLAFGLVPADREAKVADFVQSRGMACSAYGAQYLLEALFQSGRADDAVKLMTGKGGRGWWHMIDLDSTMTLEAWDARFKSNLDWNHAWGSAPANIISRFVLGVRPLEPGYRKILVAPQPGTLQSATGKVPTPLGPVLVNVQNGDRFRLEVTLPAGATAQIALPRRNNAEVWLDEKPASAKADGQFVMIDGVTPGRHVAEIHPHP